MSITSNERLHDSSSTETPTDPAQARRPHILLITLDTMRADFLSPYGAPEGSSPEIAALAKRGVVFERMLAASSRTAPAHASLFTSRWVRDHSIGYRDGSTRLWDEDTLTGRLAAAGYETAAFVSNAMLQTRVGLDSDFAHYDDELPDRERNRPIFERIAEKTTDRVVSWLGDASDAPVFLWVQYNDPHGPYTPPERFIEAVSGEAPSPLPALDIQRGIAGIPAYQVLGDQRDPRQYIARYAAEVRYLDASVGRLVHAFEAFAGDNEVIIALTADHGESLGEEEIYFSHGYGTAPNLAHIPFLLVAKGLEPKRHPDLVHHVDVMPTLLGLAGLSIPDAAEGEALASILAGRSQLPPERPLYVDVGEEVSVYQGDRFVRVRFQGEIGEARAGTAMTYQWTGDSEWSRVADAPQLTQRVVRYAANRKPFHPANALTEPEAARLRALGYLEPEKPPGP